MHTRQLILKMLASVRVCLFYIGDRTLAVDNTTAERKKKKKRNTARHGFVISPRARV